MDQNEILLTHLKFYFHLHMSSLHKSFNFIFSAILVMLCMHTKGLYKFQYKEKYVCYAYMKLVGPMFYFYNGKMLQTHFCSLNVIQDGQKVFIATFHQVSLVNTYLKSKFVTRKFDNEN